jgi:hypothetical protein
MKKVKIFAILEFFCLGIKIFVWRFEILIKVKILEFIFSGFILKFLV